MKLEKITLFDVWASTSDRGSAKRVGLRATKEGAELAAKGSGWWGTDGTVHKEQFYTDGKDIYTVEKVGKLPDAGKEKAEVLNSIKSKLTKSELEALGLTDD